MGSPANLFLIGPMGAGKTTVGRRLSQRLGLRFIDADETLEARCGVDIPYIFEREGEAGFRLREKALIDELSRDSGIVLATGGGAILDPDTRQTLSARGLVIYLHATIRQQLERTRHSQKRPLLNAAADRAELLQCLMQIREPLYRATADLVIDTDRRSSSAVVNEIEAHLSLAANAPASAGSPV